MLGAVGLNELSRQWGLPPILQIRRTQAWLSGFFGGGDLLQDPSNPHRANSVSSEMLIRRLPFVVGLGASKACWRAAVASAGFCPSASRLRGGSYLTSAKGSSSRKFPLREKRPPWDAASRAAAQPASRSLGKVRSALLDHCACSIRRRLQAGTGAPQRGGAGWLFLWCSAVIKPIEPTVRQSAGSHRAQPARDFKGR